MPKKKNGSEILKDHIIKAISDKKGKQIVILDLKHIENAITRFFVICHGTSRPQVGAIADGIMDETSRKLDVKPWHKEGFENAEWILLDYVDVVVHIFREDRRDFYQLEQLWADAEISDYKYEE